MRATKATVLCFTAALLACFLRSSMAVPNWQACVNASATSLPYCDTSLSFEARIADLISRLTTVEKIGLISPDPDYSTCDMQTNAVPRLGLPRYQWLIETNTGVASACYGPQQCATTFIGPEGLGASFNRSSWWAKGDVISSELRAFSNANWHRDDNSQPQFYLIGLDGFGPNINIVRDPRFGRNSELPGEDPFLTGSYAAAYVSGIQQVDAEGYIKMLAYLKHYDAYSVETNRGHDTYNISTFDFFDTYLPQYAMAFQQGHASGVMCSYNAENGHPSCANGWLLNLIRTTWGVPDAVVMTDCGALSNMLGPPLNAPSGEAAAAWALNNGTDLEAGSTIWNQYLLNAINQNLTTVAAVEASIRRTLLAQMTAGRFDPPAQVSWTNISTSVVNSTLHQQVSYEAAAQSFVLLKNEGVLPLKAGQKIAVVGPQAIAQYGLLSDYYGDQVCYSGDFSCITTIGDAIAAVNVGGNTVVVQGVDVDSQNDTGIAAAVAAAAAADVVVLALGIDKTIEHEGIDRVTISLPGLQDMFAQKVIATGVPVVLLLTNGGAVAIDDLIAGPKAIVEAFNPAFQARALANSLFGLENRWGKMPYTIYPANYTAVQSMTNFNMSIAPGRTYRYYQGTPLFAFGTGLSLTTFTHSVSSNNYTFTVTVQNTGSLDGDEVVMVYHSAGPDIRAKVDHPVPFKSLVAFERVRVAAGAAEKLLFSLDSSVLALTNLDGQRVIYPGTHQLIFSRGNGVDQTVTIKI
eukprot:TRINITY_DN3413_c0_g2_i1.p2 TRINITY_DN3413_c0_g2~~TRINITY_DN3413_c0_g2_i1.p2  ORF type:complete len:747 (-),score=307.36 TRINITY_DN3413_c0_g2_i1:314-2554(-)